jgi:putative endonuclease
MLNKLFSRLKQFVKPAASINNTLPSESRRIGDWAETYAKDYLLERGLSLRECNYRCKSGEIDLIMLDQKSLVFVEVRSRNNAEYGSALESVNYFKQQRLIRAAQHYLQKKRLSNRLPCRFDVVSVDSCAKVQWIQNAFTANA